MCAETVQPLLERNGLGEKPKRKDCKPFWRAGVMRDMRKEAVMEGADVKSCRRLLSAEVSRVSKTEISWISH